MTPSTSSGGNSFICRFAIAALIGVSLMSPRGIRRFATGLFVLSLILLVATFFFGTEIKGARRWINIAGLSLQPSEFVKPTFAVVTAWLFAMRGDNGKEVGRTAAIVLYGFVASLLLLQPDFGMTVVVSAVWFTQFFLAGLPMLWVAGFVAIGIGGAVGAYFLLPHVASRVDRFIDPSSGDSYQVMRSMEAFMNGGVLGRGPGEGSVKTVLPDAHTDFIFAVAAEEFGMIACLILVGLFAFIVLRGFSPRHQGNQFLHPVRRNRATRSVRLTVSRQYGVDASSYADEGDDLALYQLWRFLSCVYRPLCRDGVVAYPPPRRAGGRPMNAPDLHKQAIVLAAGGTGGHVYPALALADVLRSRNWPIAFVTDERGTAFGQPTPGTEIHHIKAASLGGGACSKLKGAHAVRRWIVAGARPSSND